MGSTGEPASRRGSDQSRGGSLRAGPGEPVEIFVLAGVRLYEEGLVRILSQDPRFRVVGSAGRPEDGLGWIKAQSRSPDICLIDLLPPSGFETARTLRVAAPDMRLIALGISDHEQEVLGWAAAGVAGFVTRETPLKGLMEAVEVVARDGSLCSPRIAATLLRRVASLGADPERRDQDEGLTPREREILTLIELGLPNKQIATELHLSLATVKNHVHSILDKLKVKGRGEAAATLRREVSRSGV